MEKFSIPDEISNIRKKYVELLGQADEYVVDKIKQKKIKNDNFVKTAGIILSLVAFEGFYIFETINGVAFANYELIEYFLNSFIAFVGIPTITFTAFTRVWASILLGNPLLRLCLMQKMVKKHPDLSMLLEEGRKCAEEERTVWARMEQENERTEFTEIASFNAPVVVSSKPKTLVKNLDKKDS